MKLAVSGLAADRGAGIIFENVGFTLERGTGLVVIGPNGAGKSTLIRAVAGLLRPSAGTVVLEGGGEEWPDVAAACHYLGPANAMKPALTVRENLTFWRDFGGQRDCDIAAALEIVGLAHTAELPFSYLSTGQRRRVSIAKLFLNRRPLWLLDEPTSGLDAAAEARFAELLRDHLEDGGIAVAATHLPLDVAGLRELRFGAAVAA
ncbi:heme ABC exporter ATP-binding protein CcmA [Oricola cellulosilytica]|uniref:Heme ABC exporter ATP-binding protein CcmA n=1 Tax=Oricola cellulosilytica TaxID=1429082 RepID=A0A4R0PE65_9HYPH|nr:heme ABC exporter ATP-binding protein CcmA [Oricola cellulosilytica]TCD15871.1 heme ABC exporter ATP-binding protein CcmA [Oricola cellulosilytica]